MPDWILSLTFVIVGLAGLIAGGEMLVRAAAALAAAARISPLVIGLTVVAFGTSAPELAVTVQSAWSGSADIALGNVVGSNIANVLLVLGVSALIAPLVVHVHVQRIHAPLVLLASLAMWLMSLDGRIARSDGGLLFLALLGYLAWSVRASRRASAIESADASSEALAVLPAAVLGQVGRLLVGLLLLSIGARLLVMGAVDIALVLGVGEWVIGLTLVAVGTSLPELFTSLIASLRGERDIAVGNVVGSNLFNILGVLGLGALTTPGGIAVAREAATLDLPIMIATAAACLPMLASGQRVDRLEGALLMAYFAAYIAYLTMRSSLAPGMGIFEWTMLSVPIPVTLLVLGLGVWRVGRPSFGVDPRPS